MDKKEKIFFYFDLLIKLRNDFKTMSYIDAGALTGTHYRHVYRYLGNIQLGIDVYNSSSGVAPIPHINALVVRKRDNKPGDGCNTTRPSTVLGFDYTNHVQEIRNILEFILKPCFLQLHSDKSHEYKVEKFAELWMKNKM